ILLLLPLLLAVTPSGTSSGMANEPAPGTEGKIAQRAKAAWEQGTIDLALGILDQGLHDNPHALALYQLRGDMLATSRHTEAALESYDTVLASLPASLEVRWSKWSVLVRSGQIEEAVAELQRIAALDPQ